MSDNGKKKHMKKMVLAATLLVLAGATVQNAHAGNNEWALAGKVLTGIAAASIVARAVIPPPPVYGYSANYAYAPSCSYYPTPVRYCPPPVVYAPAFPPRPLVYRAPVYPVYVAPPVVRVSVSGGFYRRSGCW